MQKDIPDLLGGDAGEQFHKFRCRDTVCKVFEEGRNRDAGSLKQTGTPKPTLVLLDSQTVNPAGMARLRDGGKPNVNATLTSCNAFEGACGVGHRSLHR